MKTKLTTIFALVIICLGILIWQRNQLGTLREEVAETETLLSGSQGGSERNSHDFKTTSKSTGPESKSSFGEPVAATTGPDLLEIAEDEKEKGGPFGFFLGLTRILEELKEHSSEELFVLLEELKEMDDAEESKAGEIFLVLLMTLSGVEPERALTFIDEQSEKDPEEAFQIKLMVFAEWAETDPGKAQAYLEKQSWEGAEKQTAERKVLDSLADKNLGKALDYFDTIEIHPGNLSVVIAQAARDPERREEAWRLLEKDLDPKRYQSISSGILGAIFVESGLAGMDEAAKGMKFATLKDRDRAMLGFFDLAVSNTPEEAMTWLQREITPESQAEQIPRGIRIWAMQDVAAAGNWLREQEASPTKNAAISVYANSVARLDPQGALVWTEEITEQQEKDTAKRKVLEQWHQSDPKAATAWVEKAGLETTLWLPKD